MPAPRAVLSDIHEFGLSHDHAHKNIKASGRLAPPVIPIVDEQEVVVSEQTIQNDIQEEIPAEEVKSEVADKPVKEKPAKKSKKTEDHSDQ
jgi:hypothetical protein